MPNNNQADQHSHILQAANNEIACFLSETAYPVCEKIKSRFPVWFDVATKLRKRSVQIIVRDDKSVFRWHVLIHRERNLAYLAFTYIERPDESKSPQSWNHQIWSLNKFKANAEEAMVNVFFDYFCRPQKRRGKIRQVV